MKFVGEAISSVAQSTYQDYEHIIVDDGSTDETMLAIKNAVLDLNPEAQSKVKVFSKSNSGEAETDNFAMNLSSGEFIIVLNADDVVDPALIERSVQALIADSTVVVSYPDWTIIDSQGMPGRSIKTKDFSVKRLVGDFDCLPGPGACIRRSSLEGERLRDPAFPLISDFECWQRLSLRGRFIRIPEQLASWRTHGNNLSFTSRGEEWARQAILVANKFLNSPLVAADEELTNFARMGLRRAYLLAALQGSWDKNVPSLEYVFDYLRMSVITRRLPQSRDAAILARISYNLLTGVLRRK
jgi:glycosyltransferase involved in cell wall biosynthesis